MSNIPADARIATKIVHAGLDPDPTFGSLVPAIHQTSTFVQKSPGNVYGEFDYSRAANPTRAALEKAIGELEGGLALAFSSGMAAVHAIVSAVAKSGDHVVIPDDLYGGTYRLFDRILSRWNLDYTMVDSCDLNALEEAIRPNTVLVWIETPSNPMLNVIDIESVVKTAKDAFVVVDNTFATPIHQRPLELGANAVIHSTTKYFGGHSDIIGGAVVVRDQDVYEDVRLIQKSVGAIPGPMDCFLVHRGLRTLHLRMAQHDKNGRAVSEFLKTAPKVTDVRWPGYGGMVSFNHPNPVKLVSSTRIFLLAESLGGVESLIEIPKSMTHQSVETSLAEVPADLIRLSCGVEDPVDLVADLGRAITAAS